MNIVNYVAAQMSSASPARSKYRHFWPKSRAVSSTDTRSSSTRFGSTPIEPIAVVLDGVRVSRKLVVEPQAPKTDAHDGCSAKPVNRLEEPQVEFLRGVHDARRVLRAWDQ